MIVRTPRGPQAALLLVVVSSVLSVLSPGAATAAGFALSEQNASGLGNAYAGAAAVAEDASTIFWNPAGMAKLGRGRHFVLAGHAILPSTRFSNGASQPAVNRTDLGNEGGDAGDLAFIPNVYYAMDLGPRMHFGVGVNVPFGLATEYEQGWLGRFQGIRSEIQTLNINPSVAWKASDRLALGFGINWQHGKIELFSASNFNGPVFGTALNALVPPNSEGRSTIELDGDAWGYNAGLLFDLTPATRLGLAYRSSIEYELDGTLRVTGVPAAYALSPALTAATASGNVSMNVETPDMLSISVAHQLSPRWTLLADATRTGWSSVRSLPLVRDNGVTADTLRFNFDDTMRYSVGATYRMNDAWAFRMGLAFDESPVPNATDRSVRLPDADRTWFAVGARYKVSAAGTIDLGYAYIAVEDAPIDNNQNVGGVRGRVNGTYKANVNILSVQYSHTF